ncbi:MAG: hypothetical protein HZA53_04705, partial [Planctomycetes bacterium]|nr:hypothetical protein [Planctomycetota bacterium]
LPGIELAVLSLSGATGPGSRVRVGDTLAVRFTARKTDGTDWDIGEFDFASTLVSGPTFNYQRVVAEQTDVAGAAVQNTDGSYTYTFAAPIPSTYLAPLNDSADFGAVDGELAGEALLDGTYTVGLCVGWSYTVDGEAKRDAANATFDFVVGDTGTVDRREVVKQDNCARCHADLRAHDGLRKGVAVCLLCHTAGAEDHIAPAVAGGTPGASIDFKVMVHRIHAGEHLPSVMGVATNLDGTRNYAATPTPYQLVGADDAVLDFSGVGFPIMPSAYVSYLFDSTGTTYLGTGGNGPMPRDTGYSALSLTNKRIEDKLRSGPVACAKCHGDPDDAGPLTAPAQGDLYKTQPGRLSCGACHDDVHWGQPYTANLQTMPAQATNADCTLCHAASGAGLAVEDAHVHPYSNPSLNTGVNITFDSVGSGSAPSGNHVAGDPIVVDFSVTDDAGQNRQIHQLTRFQMVVSGPTSNPQWVLPNVNTHDFAFRKSSPFTGNGTITTPVVGGAAAAQTIAVAFTSSTAFDVLGSVTAAQVGNAIGGSSGSTASVSYQGVTCTITQGTTAFVNGDRWYFEVVPTAATYNLTIPRDLLFESLGAATGAAQNLPAGNQPVYWGREVVYERTALVGAAGALTDDNVAMSRYVVTDAGALATLAVGDRLVIDAGTSVEEYGQVVRIETSDPVSGADFGASDKVYLSQQLRYDHDLGATLQEVTLTTRRQEIDYTLAATGATGIDLIAGRFTAGNPVVMSYRTHARFGWYRAPGDTLQAVYTPSTGDSEDVDASWGDWTGLPLVDGTYTVGAWTHKDFTVTPLGLPTTTGSSSNLATDNTTYRMISPPASANFLFGSVAVVEPRQLIDSGAACNACHGDLQAHGNGRRGYETCVLCHASPGVEDAPLYSFNGWYIGATRGVTMDFRTLLHKVHMGAELANASTYTVNGIFLGVAYPVQVDEIGFPTQPGGAANCATCHGSSSTAWLQPAPRDHTDTTVENVREWRAVCAACHDSDAAQAHVASQTTGVGDEACEVCHGIGREWNVEKVHKRY